MKRSGHRSPANMRWYNRSTTAFCIHTLMKLVVFGATKSHVRNLLCVIDHSIDKCQLTSYLPPIYLSVCKGMLLSHSFRDIVVLPNKDHSRQYCSSQDAKYCSHCQIAVFTVSNSLSTMTPPFVHNFSRVCNPQHENGRQLNALTRSNCISAL